MTDDSEVARIARGLLREWQLLLGGWPDSGVLVCREGIGRNHAHRALIDEGLTIYSNGVSTLTPLGLRVKAYLQSKGDEA